MSSILYQNLYGSSFHATCRDQDMPLSGWGRDHGVQRVHHKIEHDLLQLD